jgi:alanyl-tRNA synthetase
VLISDQINGIANDIKRTQKQLTVEELITLYESDGITPDFLKEVKVITEIPSNFYVKLAELHSYTQKSNTMDPLKGFDEQLPPTKLLYYEDPLIRDFSAKVVKIINGNYVILDKTAFYPRGGGQEPDNGIISNSKVLEVVKHRDLVLHRLEKLSSIKEGLIVNCRIDAKRRDSIKHHTATHVQFIIKI